MGDLLVEARIVDPRAQDPSAGLMTCSLSRRLAVCAVPGLGVIMLVINLRGEPEIHWGNTLPVRR